MVFPPPSSPILFLRLRPAFAQLRELNWIVCSAVQVLGFVAGFQKVSENAHARRCRFSPLHASCRIFSQLCLLPDHKSHPPTNEAALVEHHAPNNCIARTSVPALLHLLLRPPRLCAISLTLSSPPSTSGSPTRLTFNLHCSSGWLLRQRILLNHLRPSQLLHPPQSL